MREYKGLGNELERSLIERLVKVHYGENADALVEYVFEVLDYRKLTFSEIVSELQDIRVCSICGEASHIDFMANTEGQADTSDEQMCDWCFGNGQ